MKKFRIISILSIVFAIGLIFAGYSMIFVSDYKVDAEETSSYAAFVKDSFKSLNGEMKDISVSISNSKVMDVKYYSDFKKNYSRSVEELTMIENELDDIYLNVDSLLYDCESNNFNDYAIDNNCVSININYETLVNGYISLKMKYNSYIEEYNSTVKVKDRLQKFDTGKYNELIDFNDDGAYSGVIK